MSKKHKRLAEGEVTGHAHVALANDAWVMGNGDQRELFAPSGTQITHEEHSTILLPPGKYDVSRQQEFDPDEEEMRSVQD